MCLEVTRDFLFPLPLPPLPLTEEQIKDRKVWEKRCQGLTSQVPYCTITCDMKITFPRLLISSPSHAWIGSERICNSSCFLFLRSWHCPYRCKRDSGETDEHSQAQSKFKIRYFFCLLASQWSPLSLALNSMTICAPARETNTLPSFEPLNAMGRGASKMASILPRNQDRVLRRGLLLFPWEESGELRSRVPSSRARTTTSPLLPWANRAVITP